ncbi:actin cytoskeleton-regulatory complex protein PAN1 isoform X3 [Bombus terrestris]|uniref:Actin cytoskeleton-regulatory complex protein PAN1 isoform X3 n=1 Tax=Bombus terrestris TaxID=30195 RepID=A0A9C6W383_BOMTE|nr:actin cytoskeleton-regulatory complex protein PAN1 isoform X3 [Bombus terrestris]
MDLERRARTYVLRRQIMVAEIVARQSGSPINGETACLNSNMPATHTMAHAGHGVHGGHDAHGPLPPLTHPAHHGAPLTLQQQQQHQHQPQHQPPPPQQQPPQHHHHHQPQQQQTQQQQPPHHHHDAQQRKQREFIPDNKKDDSYWDRRRRNNEAAKRSREKRRFNDMVLEQRVMELSKENHILKAQLEAIRDKFGICGESVISTEHVLAALPADPPIVKRAKLPASAALLYARTPSPVHTSVIHQPVSGARSPRSPAQLYVPETTSYPETESFQYPYPHPAMHLDTTSALNLSRGRRAQSPFELSSGSGDEGPQLVVSSQNPAANNSLPHKLRHKSRIGDKDAASALLALQGIKQEPGPRASPPWDNEGSSDERDSGISLGAEWTGPSVSTVPESEREVKSRLDRLASEVASLQSILRIGKPTESSLVTGHALPANATVNGP